MIQSVGLRAHCEFFRHLGFTDADLCSRLEFPCDAIDPSVSDSILTKIDPDREGNQDYLRFPPFHREILQQRAWDAADPHGRVKVVLAEGVSRPNRTPPFERYRDFLVFSFQHAPLSTHISPGIYAWS